MDLYSTPVTDLVTSLILLAVRWDLKLKFWGKPHIQDSLAEKVMSSCVFADRRVPTDNAYSRSDGFHASSACPVGSLYIESYQASHAVAACERTIRL